MAIVVRSHSDQSHSVPHRQRRVVSGEHDRTSFRPFVRRHRSGNACVGFVLGLSDGCRQGGV
jgi:hypothetical protein